LVIYKELSDFFWLVQTELLSYKGHTVVGVEIIASISTMTTCCVVHAYRRVRGHW